MWLWFLYFASWLAVLDQESPADVRAAAAGRFKQVLAEVGECWLGGRFFFLLCHQNCHKNKLWWICFFPGFCLFLEPMFIQ